MTRIVSFFAAAAILAGSTSAALAERHEPTGSYDFGSQIEVLAGDLLNAKELSRKGLGASDRIGLTVAPQDETRGHFGGDR